MMRRVFVILAIVFLLAVPAFSQTWYTTDQATIAWDPVTQLSDGSPLPAGNTIRYRVFVVSAQDVSKSSKVDMGTTDQSQLTLTFLAEGQFFVGTQAERMVSGNMVSQSPISWSDNAAVCLNNQPFGVQRYLPPMGVINLRKP